MGYTKGIKWSDDLIDQKVLEVKESLGLNRMPSRKECESYFNDCALTNAISKRSGWYEVARRLGLEVKDSETKFGKSYESIASEMLQSLGHDVKRMSQNFPYDLLVDDCIKIDVKASRLYRGAFGNFYSFAINKDYATCDFYVLFAVSDDGNIGRTLVVPSCNVISNKQISVGQTSSKYFKYENRFDLISSAVDFWDGCFYRSEALI